MLKAAIRSGIAGGHEIYVSAVEKIARDEHGQIDPLGTVIRFRNHWTKSWADNGSGRVHLSTVLYLGTAVDLRQFRAR